MAKAVTSEGTFSNTEAVVRQRLSTMFDDCILCTTGATGGTGTYDVATTDPPQYYNKADDYFNEGQYEVYCYSGTNVGKTRLCSDWDNSNHRLTVTPAPTTNYGTASLLELHRVFYVVELRSAMNQAIALYRNKYFNKKKDETTISLTRTERNDVSGSYIPTYEYSLPTDCVYLWEVTTEDSVSGVKITGTLSGAFTLGETVNGSSSGASGLLSYGPSGGTYIRVREESGTFTTSDTVTGVTSEETVTSISDIDRTELAGDGKFPPENILDHRDWNVIATYPPKLVLVEGYYTVVEDLRLRLKYWGIQDDVDSDTDTIFINPDEFCEVAATFLPFSKIESNNLTAKFNRCLETRKGVEDKPPMHPPANARKCW